MSQGVRESKQRRRMSRRAKVAIPVRIQKKRRRAEGKEMVVMIGTMTKKNRITNEKMGQEVTV